jgi:hypothetical protein
MDDEELLRDILNNIATGIEKLDNFEQEVMSRQQTPGRDDLLDKIRKERLRMSSLAQTAGSSD